MKAYCALGVAALLAAVFVFAPQSFADCSAGTPGCPQPTPICPPDKPACWILPPQSIEVNAGGVSAGPGGSGGGGAPVVLTPAQYRIEIPLVTPVPFPTRRPAASAEASAQVGLTGEPASSPSGITWQEGLVAAAAAAMGAVALHGTFTSPVSGHANGGSAGVRPSTSGATSGSPSAGLSSARAGTGAQASASSAGSTSASGGEGSAFAAEPTAEERRRGEGWTNGGFLGATASVTWQGDLSNPSGGGMGAATSRLNAEDMLPRASWIPGGVRSDPGSEPPPTPTPPPPTPPPPTPPAPPSAASGASIGPTQTARDRWWEDGAMDGGQNPTPATTTPEPPTPITTPLPIPTPGPGDAARVRSGRAGAVGPSPETARRKDEDLIPTTTAPSMAGPDIEVLRQSAWLWSHPDVLAAALTDNPRGQAYLGGILPHLQPSPTGRAVVEALLAHGKVNVDILPPELRALNGSVQPWVPSIYIYDMNQPETTFAHEALHLLQRLSGVDPRNIAGEVVVQVRVPGRDPAKFWGDELGVRYRPGFSLAMEREAYAIDLTIQFELAEVAIRVAPNDPNLQKKVNDRSDEVRRLTMQGPAAAFREVLAQGRPNHAPTGASIYDPFAEGNNPPRDWRQDLARMRLAAVVPHVERAAQHAAPPGAKRPPQPAISARSPQAPTTPPTPRTGPPRQRAK